MSGFAALAAKQQPTGKVFVPTDQTMRERAPGEMQDDDTPQLPALDSDDDDGDDNCDRGADYSLDEALDRIIGGMEKLAMASVKEDISRGIERGGFAGEDVEKYAKWKAIQSCRERGLPAPDVTSEADKAKFVLMVEVNAGNHEGLVGVIPMDTRYDEFYHLDVLSAKRPSQFVKVKHVHCRVMRKLPRASVEKMRKPLEAP